jgi:hypothetical protein
VNPLAEDKDMMYFFVSSFLVFCTTFLYIKGDLISSSIGLIVISLLLFLTLGSFLEKKGIVLFSEETFEYFGCLFERVLVSFFISPFIVLLIILFIPYDFGYIEMTFISSFVFLAIYAKLTFNKINAEKEEIKKELNYYKSHRYMYHTKEDVLQDATAISSSVHYE